MKRDLLGRLLLNRSAKHPVILATNLASGEQELLCPQDPAFRGESQLLAAAREALRRDRCITWESGEERVFLQPFNPPLRMIIVGAVHIAQPLCRMAADGGYEVTVVDPRQSFASEARFPQVTISHEWPDAAAGVLALDRRSAVITLTHDPKLDDLALAAALRSEAFYIGALGSRRTHAARLARLREQGFGDAEIARIHGPVGLDIGAQSPPEIAISIMAQVIQCLRQADS